MYRSRWINSIFAALLGIALASRMLCAQGPPTADFNPDTNTWTLKNGLIEAGFRLNDQKLFQLVHLGRPGGKHWVGEGRAVSAPIFFNIDGKLLNESTQWDLVSTHEETAARNGVRQVIILRNAAANAQVTLRIEMYPGQPFLRTFYSYTNLDQSTHFIQGARFLNVRLNTEMRGVRTFSVNQVRQGTPLMFDTNENSLSAMGGAPVSVYSGAYADQCTWLALRDDVDNGIVFGWEFDGRSHVNALLSAAGDRATVWGGPLGLNISVAAGREFALPAAFVGLFEGDWDEAGFRTQRYTEAVLAAAPPDGQFPYLMYDTWGYGQNIDEATLRSAAQIASGLGVELFILDLGWARQIGEWVPDSVKFPGGLRAFSDYVHGLGMKFGLHFVPAEAAATAPVLEQHPDWTASVNNGYYGAESICLAHRPAQNWVRDSIVGLIQNYGVDWITQDGENLVKECTKTTHTHDPSNSNWGNSVNGIDALVESVRQVAPGTLWENNADGGTMSTFEAVKHYATFDSCDACEHQPRRQAVYGMSYVFPPRFIERYMQEPPIKFTTRSSMFGGPWILMQQLTQLSSSELTLLRSEAAIYKSLRGLIRDGKVFHLLPRADGVSIEAIESFNSDLDRGVIFAYRPNSPTSTPTIFPRGLDPSRNYQVSFQDSGDNFSNSGAALMSGGIKVKLPSILSAEIVYISGE